jgi:hypothetical protein
VKQDGMALQFAAAPLLADREIVLAAVRRRGLALQFAAAPLRANRDLVLEAVRQDGLALFIAGAKLEADVEIVLTAVKDAGDAALQCASQELRADGYLQRLAANVARPKRLRAFLQYARDLREANLKAQVDLWLTLHNNGELHHWIDATSACFKRRKHARLEEATTGR